VYLVQEPNILIGTKIINIKTILITISTLKIMKKINSGIIITKNIEWYFKTNSYFNDG